MERGQLPREIDLEMLRGPNYGLGGKQVWPKPFADWASRWSKKRAGDAPASVETDGGGALATAAARAAVAELLRAVAAHPSRLRVSGRAHTCVRASPPHLTRVRDVSRHRTAPSCARRLASSHRVILSCHHLWRHRRGARSAGARSAVARAAGTRAAAREPRAREPRVRERRTACERRSAGVQLFVGCSDRVSSATTLPSAQPTAWTHSISELHNSYSQSVLGLPFPSVSYTKKSVHS